MPIVKELPVINLQHGSHETPDQGMCVMEAVAYIAGEPHSDHPDCVCPVIAKFMRSWNDSLNDEDRNRLLAPLITKVVDTKGTPELELARVMLVVDWMLRDYLPAWLDLTESLKPFAEQLRAFKPIQSWNDFDQLTPVVVAARAAAGDAARAAAWAAAGAAAWAAAGAAAGATAGAAAGAAARAAARAAAGDAAWAAARAAAGDAARAAAGDAAWVAAWVALKPTVSKLQDSAINLIERMCAIK